MGSPQRLGSSLVRLEENGPTLSRWLSRARVPGDLRSAGFRKDSGLRIEAVPVTLDPSHVYRMRFERRGSVLRWTVDGRLVAELDDPFPLAGPGHDRSGSPAASGTSTTTTFGSPRSPARSSLP
jgi:hypothetical protein